MTKPDRTPILNANLPPQFRRIRIMLAREPGHPEGADDFGYIFVAPVDTEGRIDPTLWRTNREACRVARQRPGQEEQHGHLVRGAAGAWSFHYDKDAKLTDDAGYHFADERFLVGEYVSINERGKMHTYRVTTVSRL